MEGAAEEYAATAADNTGTVATDATGDAAAAAGAGGGGSEESTGNFPIEIAYEKSSESVVLFVRRGREVWGKATFDLVAKHSEVRISMRNCVIKKLVVQGIEYKESNYREDRFIDDPFQRYKEYDRFTMHDVASSLGSDSPCNSLKFLLWKDEDTEIQFRVELWYRLANAPEDLLVGLRETSVLRPEVTATATNSAGMHRHWYSDGTLDQACFWMPHIKFVPVTSLRVIARREHVVFGPGELKEIVDGPGPESAVAGMIEKVAGKGVVAHEEAAKYAMHCFVLRRYIDPNSIGVAVGPFRVMQGADGRDLSSCVVNGCLPGREGAELGATVGDLAERALAFFNGVFPGLEYPWPWYHQVFVHDAGYVALQRGSAFAGLAVLPEELLHAPDAEADVCFRKAEVIAECAAAQWFGVCIAPEEADDYWLVVGLRKWLARRFLREVFGTDYARVRDFKESDELMGKCWGRALVEQSPDAWIHPNERQSRRYELKAYFAVMTFAYTIGVEEFQAWLGRFVLDRRGLVRRKSGGGSSSSSNSSSSGGVGSLLLSERRFFEYFVGAKAISKEHVATFRNLWVTGTGFPPSCAGISVNLVSGKNSINFYSVPDVQVPKEYPECKFKVIYKTPKKKKDIFTLSGKDCGHRELGLPKNVPLASVRIRFDFNFTFPHKVRFPLPVEMMHYAKPQNKPDIRGVYEAIGNLSYKYVLERTPDRRKESRGCKALAILGSIVTDRSMYWELRAAAMRAMTSRVYSDSTSNFGADALIRWYRRTYSDATVPVVVGADTGYSVHDYLAQRELIGALSKARTSAGHSPKNVISFVLGLFRRVDTTPLNPISNRAIVAALCRALGAFDYGADSSGNRLLLEACAWLNRWLSIDWRWPGHGNAVLVEATRALAILRTHKLGDDKRTKARIDKYIDTYCPVLNQMFNHPSSSTLRCGALRICHDLFKRHVKHADLRVLDPAAISWSMEWLVSGLGSPFARDRMYAADLIRDLCDAAERRDKDLGIGAREAGWAYFVRDAIAKGGDEFYLVTIKNTRDSLFRSALIDIFSFAWGYTSEIPGGEQGASYGVENANAEPYDYMI